jgi:hypothetical protein
LDDGPGRGGFGSGSFGKGFDFCMTAGEALILKIGEVKVELAGSGSGNVRDRHGCQGWRQIQNEKRHIP